jgi:hypothetical protein
MIKVYEYSHLGGSEILTVRYPEIASEIDSVIESVRGLQKTKVSKEKTKNGVLLYSPGEINNHFAQEFHSRGYEELREYYTIELPEYATKIKGAFKQIDFVKGKVPIKVRFGNYFDILSDMAKFQYFFNENRADVGVEIVPCVTLKRQMSSGVSFGEQLIFDIERLKRHFPAVPVKVILIGMEGTIAAMPGEIEEPLD